MKAKSTFMVTLHKLGQKSQTLQVASLEDARQEFVTWRDANQLPSSQLGSRAGLVQQDGRKFARISYNGRVWAVDGAEIELSTPVPIGQLLKIAAEPVFEALRLYPLARLPRTEGYEFTLFEKGHNATHAVIEKHQDSMLVRGVGDGFLELSSFTSWTPTHVDGDACISGSAWLSEFGEDFQPPLEIRALVAAGGLHDNSEGNDICPAFRVGVSEYTLWCDAIEPSQREISGATRFWFTSSEEDHPTLMTDDVREVLAEIIRILTTNLD